MTIDEQVAQKLRTQVKPYSTDLQAAWEIVEFMNKQGRGARVSITARVGIDVKPNGYSIEVFDNNTEDESWTEADTAPLAICLAFLKLP